MAISINVSTPGAIPDLTTLKARIADYLDRDDLEALIPAFIQMAEAVFNRELRSRDMERTVIGQVTAEDTQLPDDYIAMRSIYEEGTPDRPLRALSPSSSRQESDGTVGVPDSYILVSGCIRLVPPPDGQYILAMDYYARIEPLTVFSPTNWLLHKHPDAYLYGSLFQAEAYLDNAVRASQWKGLVDELLARINLSAKNDRYGAGPIARSTTRQVAGGRC